MRARMESCPLPVRQDTRKPAGGAESAPRCWGGLSRPLVSGHSCLLGLESPLLRRAGPRRPTCLREGSRGHGVAE